MYFFGGVGDGGIRRFWPTGPVDEPVYAGECTVLCLDPREEESLPEPGTMMVLGSGLLGLAGYASLRSGSKD
jgi:hypothetical protein